MPQAEQEYRWVWQLSSPPEALWPLVSNTDRFNRDCGYPPVTVVPPSGLAANRSDASRRKPKVDTSITNARRLRANVLGIAIEWDELAFEWLAPTRYAVD